MEVNVTGSTILTIPNSHPSEIPFTIFDRFVPNYYVGGIYAFSAPTPSNAAIIHGLFKTLLHFPSLSGRFSTNPQGRPCLLIGGGGGVLVVEATVSSRLEDHLPLEPFPNSVSLHPPVNDAKHLLQLQLNRFRCGGLVVGITAHHRLADGKSMSSFFVAWGQAIRGVPIDPLPVYDRSWLQPRSPPRIEFDHWGSHFIPLARQQQHGFVFHRVDCDPSKITNIMLHFSPEFITKLRARLPEKYTKFETLLGHLWRKITIARRLDDHACTKVRLTVNGRPRLRPPVSNEFFGNLMLNANPKAKAKDLIDGGIAGAARTIHQAVMDRGNDYFRAFIDFGEVHGDEELVSRYEADGNVISPDIRVGSRLMFPYDKVDFGCGGSLCGLLRTWMPVDGRLEFFPAIYTDGGVDVVVCLLEEHVRVLREMSHSLDDAKPKLPLPAKSQSYSKM